MYCVQFLTVRDDINSRYGVDVKDIKKKVRPGIVVICEFADDSYGLSGE